MLKTLQIATLKSGEAWIQISSATFDLNAASSSAMASSGVFHPSVLLGRWFIRRATSLSSVWLMVLRSVPFGKNWRSRPLVFSLLPRCQGACGSQNQMSIFSHRASSGVASHLDAAVVGHRRGGDSVRTGR
jgi:hypothetical protein